VKLRGCTEDSKVDCKQIGFEDVDWINLAQDEVQWSALKNMVMNLWVP
jgi:hypothetical protein